MILDFQTNSLTAVTQSGHGEWQIHLNAGDNLLEVSIFLEIKAPTLDIRRSEILLKKDVLGVIPDMSSVAQKLIGVRVGPGMTKIVRELVGGSQGSDWISDLVLEAMEMLVNGITVPELRKAAEKGGAQIRVSSDGPKIFLNDIVIGPEMIKVLDPIRDSKIAAPLFRTSNEGRLKIDLKKHANIFADEIMRGSTTRFR